MPDEESLLRRRQGRCQVHREYHGSRQREPPGRLIQTSRHLEGNPLSQLGRNLARRLGTSSSHSSNNSNNIHRNSSD